MDGKKIKDWFINNSAVLLLFVFTAGGFYMMTPQKINNNTAAINKNSADIEIIQAQIRENALEIERQQGKYVTKDDLDNYVRLPMLSDLKLLIREIQNSQNSRLDRIEGRIDYLIERLDDTKP